MSFGPRWEFPWTSDIPTGPPKQSTPEASPLPQWVPPAAAPRLRGIERATPEQRAAMDWKVREMLAGPSTETLVERLEAAVARAEAAADAMEALLADMRAKLETNQGR